MVFVETIGASSIAGIAGETWVDAFDSITMENREHPMRLFARVDETVRIISSLGSHKSKAGIV